jgi:cysteine synthase
MKIRRVMPTIVEAMELPRLIQLDKNLIAAAFPLMKLLPARFMLDRARDDRVLNSASTVVETTSGTFGLALATLCALRSYRLILVSDPVIDHALRVRLENLGARVEIVHEPLPTGGYQKARLNRIAELQSEHPNHFWPSQYDNPHNPGAYASVAELFLEAVGEFDFLVGTVGSGGSICGTSKYLREVLPKLKVIGVDTLGSVIFGQPDRKRLLRGLGNSLMPKNVDHSVFDEVHWVNAAEAFLATRLLYHEHAVYAGGTSGAAYLVAWWLARESRDAKVVVLFPDEGYRYQTTIYSDSWLRMNGVWRDALPKAPQMVSHPIAAGPDWSRILWHRRACEDVIGIKLHAASS